MFSLQVSLSLLETGRKSDRGSRGCGGAGEEEGVVGVVLLQGKGGRTFAYCVLEGRRGEGWGEGVRGKGEGWPTRLGLYAVSRD